MFEKLFVARRDVTAAAAAVLMLLGWAMYGGTAALRVGMFCCGLLTSMVAVVLMMMRER